MTPEQLQDFADDIAANTEYLHKVAAQGAEKARESASYTLNEVRKTIGFRKF